MSARLGDEDVILATVLPRFPVGARTVLGPGDDAAIVEVAGTTSLVSTDVLVHGRHFDVQWSTAHDIGRRAVNQNLADIAAMGGWPTAIVVGLVVPTGIGGDWLTEFADGVAAACQGRGPNGSDVGVVGGDLSGGECLTVAVTVLGEIPRHGRAVTRAGAQAGDVLALAGLPGWSAAGLAALRAGGAAARVQDESPSDLRETVQRAVDLYRCPEPPLTLGPQAASLGATAMLDVSDGLVRDAARLGQASAVSIDLSTTGALGEAMSRLEPLARALGASACEWVLAGGEDHGLLACFPAEAPLPTGFEPVGVVGQARSSGNSVVYVDGLAWAGPQGWDHFAN